MMVRLIKEAPIIIDNGAKYFVEKKANLKLEGKKDL
jgi:hypothetical protein